MHLSTQDKADRKAQYVKAYVDFAAKNKCHPEIADFNAIGIDVNALTRYCGGLKGVKAAAIKASPKTFAKMAESNLEASKKESVKAFADFVKLNERLPSRAEIISSGICSGNAIGNDFGTVGGLESAARKAHPEIFVDMVGEVLLSPARMKYMRNEVGNANKFLITTAINGCQTHEGFWQSIQLWAKREDAVVLILVAEDPAAKANYECTLDRHLADAHIVGEDIRLNENFFVSSIRLSAKQIDPTTGLSRIGSRNGSFIYGSPKQFFELIPNSGNDLPHAEMTPGAVTLPDYDTDIYRSKRSAYISNHDHVMGAVIVEVQDRKTFHCRQVQADRDGSFIDLGKRYSPTGVTEAVTEALILGDWHSGETDPVAAECFVYGKDSVCALLKPKRLFIHDGFNGMSCSHHDKDNKVLLAQRAALGLLNVENEIKGYANDLNRFCKLVDEVVIVQSNHDEFLHRYIKDGRFLDDPQNTKIGCLLAHDMVDKIDPLQNALERSGVLTAPDQITWLNRDQEYKIAGIELGAHGDKGGNGARGSMRGVEKAYVNCVVGHAHSPAILRNAWRVGTCSLLRLNYTEGPTSWLHTSCVLYSNGSRQLISVINGSWRLAKNAKSKAKSKARA